MADFSTWDRATLEKFAREAAAENEQLRKDLKNALEAYREAVRAGATPGDAMLMNGNEAARRCGFNIE